jgi:hypothetical protein
MKTIRLPVTWAVCSTVDVKADSLEEAIEKFDPRDYDLPTKDVDYVDGSFEISTSDPEEVAFYQKS